MDAPSRLIAPLMWLLCSLLLIAAPATVAAEQLSGTLTDAATGVAITGATVEVLGTHEATTTDEDGHFVFELPAGTYELGIEAQLGDELYRSRLINQRVPQQRPATPRVYTDYFLEQGHEKLDHAFGLPSTSGRLPDGAPDSLDLGDLLGADANPTHLTVPDNPPTTIRVGRRQDHTGRQGCTDSQNPIVAIDEMHLDDYVKGVLPPEIGVFRNIAGASEVYKSFGIAAKSYALYFMLYYDSGNRRTLGRSVPPHGYSWFHIDDTACNQRYSDDRLDITTQAAEAVQSKVLVDRSDADSLGKYEYAASCGRHGTLPEHGSVDNLVPDSPPENACAGSWCGHDDCAGHQANPHVSCNSCDTCCAYGCDQCCLVRGICQWGSAAWGKAGKTYTWMLDHYQPHLQVREIATSGQQTVALVGYAYTDPDAVADSGIPGVTIELNDGQSTETNDEGRYRFDQVETSLGTVEITATKSGYEVATRSKELEAGVTNWGSVQMVESSEDGEDAGGVDDADGGGDVGGGDVGDSGGEGGRDVAAADADGPGDRSSGSRLGPLVKPSQGVSSGCSAAPIGAGGKAAFAFFVLVCLLGGARRSLRG